MFQRFCRRSTIVQSLEQMVLMSASTIEGTSGADWLSGDDNDNSIFAGAGDDSIHAPLGTNFIDGGDGNDTLVVYQGVRDDYTIQSQADGGVVVTGPGLNGQIVKNTLRSVEQILFNDGAYSVRDAVMRNSNSNELFGGDAETVSSSDPFEAVPISGGTIFGTDEGEWLSGVDIRNVIEAGGGDDTIHTPLGTNVVDGGSGFDTLVVYEGRMSDFDVSYRDNGEVVLTGPGVDGLQVKTTIRNVESIQFNEQRVDLGGFTQGAAADQSNSPMSPADTGPTTMVPSVPSEPVDSAPVPPPAQEFDVPPAPSPVDPPASASTADLFMDEVIRLTNNIRRRAGLSDLVVNQRLENAAQIHAGNLAFQDFFAHTGLDGLEPWDRALNAGYDYQTIGENIAAGQLSPAEVVEAWFNSSSHRDNLLNPAFTEIGVGYTFLQNDTGRINYNHYWTQLFGTER